MPTIYRSSPEIVYGERIPPIRLEELKGISIYYKDDFWEVANTVLKLFKGKSKKDKEEGIRRPTINGLVRKFSDLVDPGNPNRKIVEKKIREREFNFEATVYFDDEPIY